MKTKKTFLPSAFKVFLALASFTGTIGIWSFLTNKDVSSASGGLDSTQTGSVTVALPAIPTLVPLVIIEGNTRQAGQGSVPVATTLRDVQAPAKVNQTVKSPGNAPVVIPAPVTSTRSSK